MTKLCSTFLNMKKTENWLRKVMHSFEVHSNESACRKKVRLWLEQVFRLTSYLSIIPYPSHHPLTHLQPRQMPSPYLSILFICSDLIAPLQSDYSVLLTLIRSSNFNIILFLCYSLSVLLYLINQPLIFLLHYALPSFSPLDFNLLHYNMLR